MGLLDALSGSLNQMQSPQQAGLLGLAQGLLAASGPSRMPITMGQALATGLAGSQQAQRQALAMQGAGLQNQMQRLNLARTQSMYDLFEQALRGATGGQAPAQGPAPMGASQAALAQGAAQAPNAAVPGMGSFNMGGVGPTTANAGLLSAAAGAQPAASTLAGAAGGTPGSGAPGGLPMSMNPFMIGRPSDVSPQAWMIDQFLNPQLTTQVAAANLTPTEQVKNALFANGGNAQAAQQAVGGILHKQAYIPPVRLYAGGGFVDSAGHIQTMPAAAPPGFQNLQQPDGSWRLVQVPGGTQGVRTSAQAKAGGESAGKAQNTLTQVWDPTAFGGKGGYVSRPVSQVVQAASGAAPAAGGAPGPVVTPAQQAARDAEAVSLLQQEMQTQQQRLRAATSPQDVSLAQANIAALQRQLVHYGATGAPAAASTPGAPAGGPLPTQPPLGMNTTTTTAQNAASKLMHDQQDTLIDQDSVYPQARASLLSMIHMAQNPGIVGTLARFVPDDVGTRLSTTDAEYDKAHANFVALEGKALGDGGTDASRATIDASVPTWDKPQAAKVEGLNAQLNQLDMAHLKRMVMGPTFQQGDQKGYTALSQKFDSAVTPGMMPQVMQILSMRPGPQRAATAQAMVKANPALKGAFNLLITNGVL